MRLTSQQMQAITEVIARLVGDAAEVYIYGSRLNDQAKGGDVDILLETEQHIPRITQGRIKMELERRLGLPIDILVHVKNRELTPFQTIARAHSVRLEMRHER